MTLFCISKILLFGCSFSNRHATERRSKTAKTQIALLSESKLKFAVYQNGGNYHKPFYEGNKSSVKQNEDQIPLFISRCAI